MKSLKKFFVSTVATLTAVLLLSNTLAVGQSREHTTFRDTYHPVVSLHNNWAYTSYLDRTLTTNSQIFDKTLTNSQIFDKTLTTNSQIFDRNRYIQVQPTVKYNYPLQRYEVLRTIQMKK